MPSCIEVGAGHDLTEQVFPDMGTQVAELLTLRRLLAQRDAQVHSYSGPKLAQ